MASWKALILAAGEGTRLRPLTLDRPKPMVPVHGKPVIGHIVEWLRDHDVREIAVNLHYRPERLVAYLGDGRAHGVRIRYSHEDPVLGTAGAVRHLADFWGEDPFLVVYGDVLTDLDLTALQAAHAHHRETDPRTAATLALYRVDNPTEVGLVELDPRGRIRRFVEKPQPHQVFTDLANAGVLVMEPTVLSQIPPGRFYDFGLHLFPELLRQEIPLYGWVVPPGTRVLDIGTPDRYALAQRIWPTPHPEPPLP